MIILIILALVFGVPALLGLIFTAIGALLECAFVLIAVVVFCGIIAVCIH